MITLTRGEATFVTIYVPLPGGFMFELEFGHYPAEKSVLFSFSLFEFRHWQRGEWSAVYPFGIQVGQLLCFSTLYKP